MDKSVERIDVTEDVCTVSALPGKVRVNLSYVAIHALQYAIKRPYLLLGFGGILLSVRMSREEAIMPMG